MARPHIVRADTIDLQDQSAPSAANHPKHPLTDPEDTHDNIRLEDGTQLAPHQASTLREVAHEAAEEQGRSPRVSWTEGGDPVGGVTDDIHNVITSHLLSSSLGSHHTMAAAASGGSAGGAGSGLADSATARRHDALALAQNGGGGGMMDDSSDEGDVREEEDDEDDEDESDEMDDDMMDKISSSPSIEDEDIDFEFVYALHTFVATLEGQANATKGDTMVLLDDSNSYWWLVRVVKDSSIGYLPAEHIETPTERLARLNKHRNVDLSATMLGDQAIKQKSTFKGIRKRRKTVAFTEPTYVDYSDFDYSSDEEDTDELFGSVPAQDETSRDANQTVAGGDDSDNTATVEPLKTRSKNAHNEGDAAATSHDGEDEPRTSEEILDGRLEPSRSKNGTVRNTDSFYRDETVETKKITLTPNLLRDDTAARTSSDSAKTDRSRPSLESKLEKELVSDKEKKKKDKEKQQQQQSKDKKSNPIRSFFSRKDRKKTNEEDEDSHSKPSTDMSEPRDSEDPVTSSTAATSTEESLAPTTAAVAANSTKQSNKLQKQPPRSDPHAPAPKSILTKDTSSSPTTPRSANVELASYLAENAKPNDVSNTPPSSMRIVRPELQGTREVSSQQNVEAAGLETVKDSTSRTGSGKPQSAAQAATRMELEDSDSSDEEGEKILRETQTPPQRPPQQQQQQLRSPLQNASAQARNEDREEEKLLRPKLPGAFPDSYQTVSTVSSDRTVTQEQYHGAPSSVNGGTATMDGVSEDPSSASHYNMQQPPALVSDVSSPEGGQSPADSPSPVPSDVLAQQDNAAATTTTANRGQESPTKNSNAAAAATWDDVKLRAFFDEGDHVRDLLAVVYDSSRDVVPAGKDHPLVGGLFREQNAKLAEITTQLDNMLGDWLARKQRLRGSL